MADLLVIVPSRGRPESVARVVDAWQETGALDAARLVWAIDADDPTIDGYRRAIPALAGDDVVSRYEVPQWMPMVDKLDLVATDAAETYPMLGFAGDDHRPRTHGWATRYISELRALGTGIVYGDDRIQGERLPTQWAMTADIVRALRRMVPADVEHLYSDNSVLDLGQGADCIRYLPDVVIEHCHPVAGRGVWDRGYERVNSRQQYARDHAEYQRWRADRLWYDVGIVRGIRAAGEVTTGA